MTTIVTRSGKGSPLTHTEVDTNFTNLNTAKLEAGAIALGSAATPSISFTGDLNTGIYSPGADQVAVATNGVQRLTIDSAGNVISAGDLYANSTNGLVLFNGDPASYNISRSGGDLTFKGSGSISVRAGGTGANNAEIVYSSSPFLAFKTANSERLRITSAGLVGIGTATATLGGNSFRLAVVGTKTYSELIPRDGFAVADNTATAQGVGGSISLHGIYDSSGNFTAFAGIEGQKENGTSGNYAGALVLKSRAHAGNLNEAMRIDSSQRVGIGTTSPSLGLLEVSSTNGVTLAIKNTSPTTVGNEFCQLTFNNTSNASANFESAKIKAISTNGGANLAHLTFENSGTERARIDSSGRLLVGTSTARAIGTANFNIQSEGLGAEAGISTTRNANSTSSSNIRFVKTRGTAIGSTTIVQSGDTLGDLGWWGTDGTNAIQAASILGVVDGTPGANDMPGRLVFSTTAAGASSPTERLRITSTGQVRLAGAGITFNGDTAAANELDDYEEGTHTAELTPSGSGSITLNAIYRTLAYTKVGRLVSIRGTLIASSSSSPVGYVTVSLPFTPAAVSGIGYAGGSVFVDSATGVNANQFVLMITAGGARIYLGDGTALQSDSAQAIASAGQIYLEMNYHV